MDPRRRAGAVVPRMLGTAAVLALGAGLGLGLSGCAAAPPATSPAPSPSASAPSASTPAASTPAVAPSPLPAPTLRPDQDARTNLAYFDFVASGVVAANPAAGGRDFIDALVAAGFDRARMEVTFDETSAALAADSIQFAVRFDAECLIGQNGPATGGYHGAVMPVLASGTCLVGATRQIDW